MAFSEKMQKVPVFILAGGLGTRLSEETQAKPKPMVEIGEIPILVHIMRSYYAFGFNDFIVCAGYRAWEIKKYFLTYEFRHRHLQIDHRERFSVPTSQGIPEWLQGDSDLGQERWRVRVLDTGMNTQTGGRIARAFDEISKTDTFENFAVTYGDGLSDANLSQQYDFHLIHGKIGTVLGVYPTARFGEIKVDSDQSASAFLEKHQSTASIVSGGFFFFKKEFRKFIESEEDCILERQPLAELANQKQLKVMIHRGFWHPMDTLRDKKHLQNLWESGEAAWHPARLNGYERPSG